MLSNGGEASTRVRRCAESYAAGQAKLEEYLDANALGKAVLTGLYKRNK